MQEELATGKLLMTDSCWNHQKFDAFQQETLRTLLFHRKRWKWLCLLLRRLRLFRRNVFVTFTDSGYSADVFVTFANNVFITFADIVFVTFSPTNSRHMAKSN